MTTAWINTALIALVLASPLGPVVNSRRLEAIHKAADAAPADPLSTALLKQLDDRILWASVCTFTGVLIGIVFLMTVKPGLLGSLATIIVALALGFIYGMVWYQAKHDPDLFHYDSIPVELPLLFGSTTLVFCPKLKCRARGKWVKVIA